MDDFELDELVRSLGRIALYGDRGNPGEVRAQIRATIAEKMKDEPEPTPTGDDQS